MQEQKMKVKASSLAKLSRLLNLLQLFEGKDEDISDIQLDGGIQISKQDGVITITWPLEE